MTDRYKGFIVTLGDDLRDDDAAATIAAIKQIKGVIAVKPVLGGDMDDEMARERVRHELWKKIHEAFYPSKVKS